jgi:ABC-type Mn2+/Zn2+ transport system ATPase subunit
VSGGRSDVAGCARRDVAGRGCGAGGGGGDLGGGAAVLADGLAAGYGDRPVLRDVTFAVEPGRTVCVLGPNGGGKTTLFRVLTGELAPSAGRIGVGGRPAYVAQTERTRLDFPVSALDVALMGALATGRWWLPPRRAERQAARRALARVGLADEAGTPFGELSGGQRQRALLARALVQDARVLLLDEPLAGVDPASAQLIDALFGELRGEGRTLLVSSHDVESARAFDLVLCLHGRQVGFGAPAETLDRATLEETYGRELIVLEEHGPARAVTVQHHEHGSEAEHGHGHGPAGLGPESTP